MTLRLSLGRSNRRQRGRAGKWWRKDWRDGWKEKRPFCRLEKVTEMGGSREKRTGGEKGKEFKGRRGWCAISIAPENIHLLLPRSGCVVFLSFFTFFFCSFRWPFMQRASIKILERILLASLRRVFFDRVFRNYWYEEKTIDWSLYLDLKYENVECEFLESILRKLILKVTNYLRKLIILY